MNLASVGVGATDERIYRLVLRSPSVVVASVVEVLGLDRAEVDAAVRRLTRLGLLHLAAGEVLTATDPHLAMDDLVRARVAELDAELHQIAAAQATLPALLAEQVTGEPIELIERIDDRDEVRRRVRQIATGASECLAIFCERTLATRRGEESAVHNRGRTTVHRTVVPRQAMADQRELAYRLGLHRTGDHHRVTDKQVQTMVLFDRVTAVVQVTPGGSGTGALLIRQPGVVATLVGLFEQAWASGTDLEPAQPLLTPEEQQVLSLLNQMDKDDAAARAMGVSVRTFRGQVATLMARLGAGNRFEAGVRAKERGWI